MGVPTPIFFNFHRNQQQQFDRNNIVDWIIMDSLAYLCRIHFGYKG
eukprot:gene13688-21285_t